MVSTTVTMDDHRHLNHHPHHLSNHTRTSTTVSNSNNSNIVSSSSSMSTSGTNAIVNSSSNSNNNTVNNNSSHGPTSFATPTSVSNSASTSSSNSMVNCANNDASTDVSNILKFVRPDILNGIKNFLSGTTYREVIESSSHYNNGIVGERKLRLPYLDSQTGVAQSDCCLWMNRTDRMPGSTYGQLYSYPAKRWKKKRRQYLINDAYLTRARAREASESREAIAASMSNHQLHSHASSGSTSVPSVNSGIPGTSTPSGAVPATAGSNGPNDLGRSDTPMSGESGSGSLGGGTGGGASNSNTSGPGPSGPGSSSNQGNSTNSGIKAEFNSESNDKFYGDSKDAWYSEFDDGSDLPDAGELDDPESDYEDEEYSGRSKRKKRKDTPKRKRIEYTDAEKPYACETCGARYKTRPGLSYHNAHSHQNDSNTTPAGSSTSTPDNSRSSVGGQDEDSSGYGGRGTSNGPSSGQPGINSAGGSSHHPTMYAGPHPTTRMAPHMPHHPGSQMHPGLPGHHQVPPGYPGSGHPPHPQQTHHSQSSHPPHMPPTTQQSQTSRSSSSANGNADEPGFGGIRPPGKGSVASSTGYCDFCLGGSDENKKTNSAENLVSCSDCGRSAHPSCLQFTPNMLESVKKYRWQCIECKSCGLCGTSDNDVSV